MLFDKPNIAVSAHSQSAGDLWYNLLSSLGFTVTLHDRPHELINQLVIDAGGPSLAIVDLSNEAMDENLFLQELDKKTSNHSLPVLFTSPETDPNTITRHDNPTEFSYLHRPFEIPELVKSCNSLLGKQQQRQVPSRSHGVILEDVKTTGIIIQKLLDVIGVKSTVCKSETSFFDYLTVVVPELLIVSSTDSETSAVCRKIRTGLGIQEAPLVVISNAASKESVYECLRQGANDHIPKPIAKEEFFARVSNLLKISSLQRNLHEKQKKLESLAFTDGLTQIFNRAYLDKALLQELERARRMDQPLGLLMMDLDYFKQVNDTYGHELGDAVLQEFARLLEKNTRSYDLCCRYGGEEFCVLLPNTSASNAVIVAERIRKASETRTYSQKQLRQTISIGTAVFQETSTEATIVADADKALYSAKQAGRNRTIMALPKSQRGT